MSQDERPLTIALPAGRLAEESIDFFARAGLAEFNLPKGGRSLTFLDSTGRYQILLVRSQDVPTYVLNGGADAGITGRDVLAEGGYEGGESALWYGLPARFAAGVEDRLVHVARTLCSSSHSCPRSSPVSPSRPCSRRRSFLMPVGAQEARGLLGVLGHGHYDLWRPVDT